MTRSLSHTLNEVLILKPPFAFVFFVFTSFAFSACNPTPDPVNTAARNRIRNDHSDYETVTGESADDEKSIWDSFYKDKNFVRGKEPIGFLKEHLDLIPKGKAFVPAMGEGRNAIFLAKRGFTVDGNDLSEVAVEKALAEAKLQKVSIKGTVGDLLNYNYPEGEYNFVLLSLFFDKRIIPSLRKTLKKGGYFMIYCRLQVLNPQKNLSPDDYLVKGEDIKAAVKDFQIITYKEYADQGDTVVGVLAKKP